jgi:hypothetical protein
VSRRGIVAHHQSDSGGNNGSVKAAMSRRLGIDIEGDVTASCGIIGGRDAGGMKYRVRRWRHRSGDIISAAALGKSLWHCVIIDVLSAASLESKTARAWLKATAARKRRKQRKPESGA